MLFARCADLLLERIRAQIPSALVRAYADGTAVIIHDLWTDAPRLAQIFEEMMDESVTQHRNIKSCFDYMIVMDNILVNNRQAYTYTSAEATAFEEAS